MSEREAALSELLRASARRTARERGWAQRECEGRYWAEQMLRYAPIADIVAYRTEVSAAFFRGEQVPPVPRPDSP